MSRAGRSDIIRDLKERLRRLERHSQPGREPVFAPSSSSPWFLARPLEWGTLVEWLSPEEGSGAATLALALAGSVARQHAGALVVVDRQRAFYPPAAAALGIPLERSVIVRPDSDADALWALEQSLRSGAAAIVVGWIGRLRNAPFRRLQLAAETGASVGFLLRPASCRQEPSWAEMRLLVSPVADAPGSPSSPSSPPSSPALRRLSMEVLHCRGGTILGEPRASATGVIEVELNDETGHVRLAPRLGHPAVSSGAAGA